MEARKRRNCFDEPNCRMDGRATWGRDGRLRRLFRIPLARQEAVSYTDLCSG